LECADHLLARDVRAIGADGRELSLPDLKHVYLFCVVLDHYPSLSFQAEQFLRPTVSGRIPSPFVTDVFTLDVMTEFLSSPLHLLNYIGQRTSYGNRIFAGHEIVTLAFHLQNNLWLSEDVTTMYMLDDISSSLDAAMAVRRDGVPGERTPKGILTALKGTLFEHLIRQLDRDPRSGLVDLGLMLLKMSATAAKQVGLGIEHVARTAYLSEGDADITIGRQAENGLTIHSNHRSLEDGQQRLIAHVLLKKYQQKSPSWFGIAVSPGRGDLLYGFSADFAWEFDQALEGPSQLKMGQPVGLVSGLLKKRRIGRNDPCPCGSNKKYKKCHGS
jgi:hypothetical protein